MSTLARDNEKKEIYIPDLGVTFRTALAVAAKGHKETGARQWHIVYKSVKIASVKVKDDFKDRPEKVKVVPNFGVL